VKVKVEHGTLYFWVETPKGEKLKGRDVEVRPSGVCAASEEKDGVRQCPVKGPLSLSVRDRATSVMALVEVGR